MPANTNLTIQCPSLHRINLFSPSGQVLIDQGAWLKFEGCDVFTIATRSLATAADVIPNLLNDYFGASSGTVQFTDSRFLMPSEVRTSAFSNSNFEFFCFFCNFHVFQSASLRMLTGSHACSFSGCIWENMCSDFQISPLQLLRISLFSVPALISASAAPLQQWRIRTLVTASYLQVSLRPSFMHACMFDMHDHNVEIHTVHMPRL